MVSETLFKSITKDMIKDAKQSGELFKFSMHGRKNDNNSLYRCKDVLMDIVRQNGGSTVVDKAVLETGLTEFVGKVDVELSHVGNQAYALKLLLMQVSRIKRNMTTGARLAPWLLKLVQMASHNGTEAGMSETTEYSEDGRKKRSTKAPTYENDADPCSSPPRRSSAAKSSSSTASSGKRRLLLRMPTTPSDRDTPLFLRKAASADPWHDLRQSDDGEDGTETTEASGKPESYIYYWDEASGGMRMPCNPGASTCCDPEPCQLNSRGPHGFVVSKWKDGSAWQSAVGNLICRSWVYANDPQPPWPLRR